MRYSLDFKYQANVCKVISCLLEIDNEFKQTSASFLLTFFFDDDKQDLYMIYK